MFTYIVGTVSRKKEKKLRICQKNLGTPPLHIVKDTYLLAEVCGQWVDPHPLAVKTIFSKDRKECT